MCKPYWLLSVFWCVYDCSNTLYIVGSSLVCRCTMYFKHTFSCFIPIAKSKIFFVPSTLISIASRSFSLNFTDATILNIICTCTCTQQQQQQEKPTNQRRCTQFACAKGAIIYVAFLQRTCTSVSSWARHVRSMRKSGASKSVWMATTLLNTCGCSARTRSKIYARIRSQYPIIIVYCLFRQNITIVFLHHWSYVPIPWRIHAIGRPRWAHFCCVSANRFCEC